MMVKIEVVIMNAKDEVQALDDLKEALLDKGIAYYISSSVNLEKYVSQVSQA